MKKLILSLTALLCVLCLTAGAFAENAGIPAVNGVLNYTLLEDGSGYEISGCSPDAETVTVPAEHEGLPVVAIAGEAFLECEKLKEFRTEENQAVFYAEDGVLFTVFSFTVTMYMLNKAMATLLVMVWNYFTKRAILTRKKRSEG